MSDLTREEREALCPLTLAPCVPKCEDDMLRLCWMDAIERNPEALDRFEQAAYERGAAEVRARVERFLSVGRWYATAGRLADELTAILDPAPSPSADDEGVARCGVCQASPDARAGCEELADELPEIRCLCGRAPGKPGPSAARTAPESHERRQDDQSRVTDSGEAARGDE